MASKMSCFSNKEEPPKEPLMAGEEPVLRIVLLGKVGVGKSASGNTILGKDVFPSKFRLSAVTETCQTGYGNLSRTQNVVVIDTPGLFSTHKTDELMREIKKSIELASPGPHVFLIVLKAGERYTPEEEDMVEIIGQTFGEKVFDHTMVLFTRGKELTQPIAEFIQSNEKLHKLIEQRCHNYQVFENTEKENQDQVLELVKKINENVRKAKGGYYTPKMLKKAEAALRKKVQNEKLEGTKGTIFQTAAFFGIIAGCVLGYFACNGEMTPKIGAVVGGLGGGLLGIGLAFLILFIKERIQCKCPCKSAC